MSIVLHKRVLSLFMMIRIEQRILDFYFILLFLDAKVRIYLRSKNSKLSETGKNTDEPSKLLISPTELPVTVHQLLTINF